MIEYPIRQFQMPAQIAGGSTDIHWGREYSIGGS
jgi:hypothetical protein